jgi:hypothetical protein
MWGPGLGSYAAAMIGLEKVPPVGMAEIEIRSCLV